MGCRVALMVVLFEGLGQDAKVAVPPEDALKGAEKTIREVFREEYASRTPASQLTLAKKLIEQAKETKEDAALRYVQFREACDLASRAGALDTLLRGLDELSAAFQVNGLSLREFYLSKTEPNLSGSEALGRFAEAEFRLVQEAVDQDQFDIAAKAAQASLVASRKAKDPGLAARAEAAIKSVSEMKGAFEKARKAEEVLAAAPDDPNANQTWGDWLCLLQGRWDKGLAFLAKGPEGALRTIALKEFSATPDVASLVEVADGWWDLAEREKHPLRKSRMLAHARSVYTTALPRSTGLIRAKIGKRLEFDKDPPAKEASGREEEEALKAETALAANPEDPGANLTLGRYLAFQKNDWAGAIPRLAKGSDATLKSLAQMEIAEPRSGSDMAGVGDAWADAAKKFPGLKKSLQDRAVFWYVKAWPALEGPSKDKLRERFRKSFQTPGGPLAKSPPKEWSNPTPEAKAGVSTVAPRTGRNSFQINCAKIREGNYVPVSQSVLTRPLASYELSCWVLTDDTNSPEDMLVAPVYTQDARLVLHPSVTALPDQPWYKKIEVRFTAPETAVKMTVGFGVRSIKGTIFIDDLSLKQDGKEILKNGSFEQ